MEKQFFATIKYDMNNISEKLKAVIEAKEKFEEAVRDLRDATDFDKTEIILHETPPTFTVADGWQERPSYQRMS